MLIPQAFLALFLFESLAIPASRDTIFREEFAFGSFEKATRMAITPQGIVLVIDESRNIVLRFQDPMDTAFTAGGYGWQPGSFDRPTGITTDGLNVYISDYGNHRIQRLDRNLAFLSTLSTRENELDAGRFGYPTGVQLSKRGELLVLDGENLRVVRFSQDSRFQQSFGGIESNQGKLVRPSVIKISADERMYVAEPSKIIEFDYFGNLVKSFGDGILQNVRSLDITEFSVVVLTGDAITWFSREGRMERRLSLHTLLPEQAFTDVQDLTIRGDLWYILDSKRVHVFRLVVQ